MSVAGPGPDRSLPLPNSAAGGRVLNLLEPRLLRLAEIAVVTPTSACVLKGWGGGGAGHAARCLSQRVSFNSRGSSWRRGLYRGTQ